MRLLNLINVFKKPEEKSAPATEYRGLADFLLHAPEDRKIEVFTEAARRANEDQRELFERARMTV